MNGGKDRVGLTEDVAISKSLLPRDSVEMTEDVLVTKQEVELPTWLLALLPELREAVEQIERIEANTQKYDKIVWAVMEILAASASAHDQTTKRLDMLQDRLVRIEERMKATEFEKRMMR